LDLPKVVAPPTGSDREAAQEIAAIQEKRWLEENGAALDAANAYVKAHGLPLARLREF